MEKVMQTYFSGKFLSPEIGAKWVQKPSFRPFLKILSITPPWVFFTIFKLHEWYQIAQSVLYVGFGAKSLFTQNWDKKGHRWPKNSTFVFQNMFISFS